MGAIRRGVRVVAAGCGLLMLVVAVGSLSKGQDPIDRNRVKELYEKSKRGDKLTPDEQKYLDRALQDLKAKGKPEQNSVGYKPLTEMSATDKHFGAKRGVSMAAARTSHQHPISGRLKKP